MLFGLMIQHKKRMKTNRAHLPPCCLSECLYLSEYSPTQVFELWKIIWAVHGGAAHFLPHLPESGRRLSVKKEPVLISSSVTKCQKSLTTRRWFTHTDGNGAALLVSSNNNDLQPWLFGMHVSIHSVLRYLKLRWYLNFQWIYFLSSNIIIFFWF